jgi:hypothetical protein
LYPYDITFPENDDDDDDVGDDDTAMLFPQLWPFISY